MPRRSFTRVAAAIAASVLFLAFAAAAGPQQKKAGEQATPPPGVRKGEDRAKAGIPTAAGVGEKQATAIINRMVADFDLRPRPLPDIPDNPPPHEGAHFELPYVVEPPDLILVEVLEALPGRPISGERLIRPDGKISLGFYGDVHVRGLTIPQVKVAIIKHLRKYLSDDILGLRMQVLEPTDALPERPMPGLPEERNPFDNRDEGKAAPSPKGPGASLGGRRSRAASFATLPGSRPIHFVGGRANAQAPEAKAKSEGNPARIMIPVPGPGQVKITIDVQGTNPANPPPPAEEVPGPAAAVEEETWRVVPPEESEFVFVDMTAYNSKNYYIIGDVTVPGRLPHTGNETVLDALQYAGGLLPTAEPRDIHLVRPGRNGKPSRVYRVDLEEIQEKGDVRTNYQIFPGDRLVVGRNEVVKQTVEIDRLQAPIQAIATSIQQNASMLRSLNLLSPGRNDEVLRDLVDFWAKEVSRKGEPKLDEAKLREILLRQLKTAPAAPRSSPAPGPR